MRTLILTMVLVGLVALPGNAQKQRPKTKVKPDLPAWESLEEITRVLNRKDLDNETREAFRRLKKSLESRVSASSASVTDAKPGSVVRLTDSRIVVREILGAEQFLAYTFRVSRTNIGTAQRPQFQADSHKTPDFVIRGYPTKQLTDRDIVDLPDVVFTVERAKLGSRTLLAFRILPEDQTAEGDLALVKRWFGKEADRRMQADAEARDQANEQKKTASASQREKAAAARLGLIRQVLATGDKSTAIYQLRKLLKEDADTKAASEAEKLLKIVEKE